MQSSQDSNTRSGHEWVEVLTSIEDELLRLGIKREGKIFDFTPLSNAMVADLLEFLCSSGLFVLHGSNSEVPYSKLLARQANDASKESGNRKAVYATSDPRIALFCAVINRRYLREELNSYTHGYEVNNDKFIVKVTDNLYRLFLERSARLVADGYVYVLDKSAFILAGGATNEYQAAEDQEVTTVFKVSKRFGQTLFIVGRGDADTVLPYSPEECCQITSAKTRQ